MHNQQHHTNGLDKEAFARQAGAFFLLLFSSSFFAEGVACFFLG